MGATWVLVFSFMTGGGGTAEFIGLPACQAAAIELHAAAKRENRGVIAFCAAKTSPAPK